MMKTFINRNVLVCCTVSFTFFLSTTFALDVLAQSNTAKASDRQAVATMQVTSTKNRQRILGRDKQIVIQIPSWIMNETYPA